MKKSGVVIIIILLVVIGILAAVFPFLLFFAVPFAFVFIFSMLKDARKGAVVVDYVENPDAADYSFISDSVAAAGAQDDGERLRLLLGQYPGFQAFVASSLERDGELPPFVPCRDVLPELLMRFGRWDEAERIIRDCIAFGAYGQDGDGSFEMDQVRLRHSAADAALAFLSENPGQLQSKIYAVPALSGVDHDSLVWFCRFSHQIRKEKDEKSNRLYVGGDAS